MKLEDIIVEACPPIGTKLTKKQLREKVMHLQRVCEFLIEQIHPQGVDGLIEVGRPAGIGFAWKPKSQ